MLCATRARASQLGQAALETVVPKELGAAVLVVEGPFRGQKARVQAKTAEACAVGWLHAHACAAAAGWLVRHGVQRGGGLQVQPFPVNRCEQVGRIQGVVFFRCQCGA